jgi:hypothetical protein
MYRRQIHRRVPMHGEVGIERERLGRACGSRLPCDEAAARMRDGVFEDGTALVRTGEQEVESDGFAPSMTDVQSRCTGV